ncbi:MAG: hypothetical protein K940chlam9_00170 [Chlamydiae bacterium]|nr:hypothetical protein [Chlamydiota bacterium]
MEALARLPRKILSLLLPSRTEGLGTISGVYLPSVLMMLGVVLYLRLGWITGNVGPLAMSGILTLSLLIMILTSLSMTVIVSNMPVGGGGAYYMISRSLGMELGSAIGIALFLCQCFSASLCVSGFAESIHNVLPHIPVKAFEVGSLATLAFLTFFSTRAALSTQFLIFIALLLSFFSIFTGSGATLPPVTEPVLPVLGFWGAFAMFFPAMTGIEIGMAMSGTLKNPARSLPLGIIGSLLSVYVIYLVLSLFLSHTTSLEHLRSDPFIVYRIASIPKLILIGIWGATLSSSLSCMIGAPRMLQAFAEDGVLPKIFAKTFGEKDEPRVAVACTFLITLLINTTTTINQVIPLVAMICLISYGSLNLVVYFEEILKNPSWRPSFRLPWILPLLGGIGCLATMWMFNPLISLVGTSFVLLIYLWVSRKNLQAEWQDMRYSLFFYLYRKITYRLARLSVAARNWRPNILALTQSPLSRENLLHFSHSLTQGKGLQIFASIIPDYFHEDFPLDASKKVFEDFLEKKKIPSLVEICSLKKGYVGVRKLIDAYSFGILQPNTILLPQPDEDFSPEFGKTLQEIYHLKKNILILREQGETSASIFSEKGSKKKTLDIWWEGDNRQNLDLILSLYSTLRNSPLWKNSIATIKMIVDSPQAKENLENYLTEFLETNRVDLEIQIHLLSDCDSPIEMIPYFSQETDLVCLGLRPPEEEESPESYTSYFKQIDEKVGSLQNVLFYLHGEELDLRDMWIFPT